MAWAEAHSQGASAERVRRLAARLAQVDGVERVGEQPVPGRPARYSTAELIALERSALTLVDGGKGVGAPVAPIEAVEDTIAKRGERLSLSAEQRAMVRAVATSPDRVVCVIGLAGAGKTTATHALAAAFRSEGVPVLGAAPSGVAAEKLQDETGIPSTTLHRLLGESARVGLPRGCVLIIDEVGMAETRILAPVLEAVEQAEGKAVLIGDPLQLPAVGAGGLFAGIVERHGAVELRENRRQRDELEREALAAIRRGFGRDYLAFAEGKERLVVSENPLATMRLRLIEQARIATEKARAASARKLEKAESDLVGLGLFARSRRRDELHSEIAIQQTAIRVADEKLAELDQQGKTMRLRGLTADRGEANPTPERQRAIARRVLEPDRGAGLDL